MLPDLILLREFGQRGAERHARDAEQVRELLLRRAGHITTGFVPRHDDKHVCEPFGRVQSSFGVDDVECAPEPLRQVCHHQFGPSDIRGNQPVQQRPIDGDQARLALSDRIILSRHAGKESQLPEHGARSENCEMGKNAIFGMPADGDMAIEDRPEDVSRIAPMLDELAIGEMLDLCVRGQFRELARGKF
nr:hypothetical protein [Sphingobium herbicidovorans]